MQIELPILCHDTTSSSLQELGIKYNLSECDVKPMTFYSIDSVTPYKDGDFEGTHIFSGNTIFICPIQYDKVKTLVHERGA